MIQFTKAKRICLANSVHSIEIGFCEGKWLRVILADITVAGMMWEEKERTKADIQTYTVLFQIAKTEQKITSETYE